MDKKTYTKLVQLGRASFAHSGAVNMPTYQTSTVLFPDLESYHKADRGESAYPFMAQSTDSSYGIAGTPTSFALRDAMLEFEKGEACFLTPSGLSAISCALLATLNTGDHILMPDSVYGPTRRFCHNTLKSLGIETTFYDPTQSDLGDLVQDNTRALYLESPGSLTFDMQPIDELVAFAKQHELITLMDNSWGNPLFFAPLTHGIDISLVAVTKYLAGHSDVIMGAIITNEETAKPVARTYRNMGLSVSPADCSLVLRGMRTVGVRLAYQQPSALAVAKAVQKHPKVRRVIYPALEGDAGHALWKHYFSGATTMFSVELDREYTLEEKKQLFDHLEIFGIGVSWGGYESLMIDFDPQGIRTSTKEKWDDCGTMLRLYVGLEDTEDLIDEVVTGLDRLPA